MRTLILVSILFGTVHGWTAEKNLAYEKKLQASMEDFSQKILKCHPQAVGKQQISRTDDLQILISPQGKAVKVDFQSSQIPSLKARQCVQKELMSLQLPPSPGTENYDFQASFSYDQPVENQWLNVTDLEETNRTINLYSIQLKLCYKDSLATKEKKFQGDIFIAWKVNDHGQVQDIAFPKNEIQSGSLKTCIREKMLGWDFPKAPEGLLTSLNYTFSFREKN